MLSAGKWMRKKSGKKQLMMMIEKQQQRNTQAQTTTEREQFQLIDWKTLTIKKGETVDSKTKHDQLTN